MDKYDEQIAAGKHVGPMAAATMLLLFAQGKVALNPDSLFDYIEVIERLLARVETKARALGWLDTEPAPADPTWAEPGIEELDE